MKLNCEEDIKLRKCLTNELGFSLFKGGNFEPKYNYFKPDENTLEIRIELPGKVKPNISHKVLGDETIVMIKGTKEKDKIPENEKDNLLNIREFGEFELNIPLKVQDFKIINNKPKEG